MELSPSGTGKYKVHYHCTLLSGLKQHDVLLLSPYVFSSRINSAAQLIIGVALLHQRTQRHHIGI